MAATASATVAPAAGPSSAASEGDFSTAEYLFDAAVTNAVARHPTKPATYCATLHEDWFNDNGTAFGGYVLALSTRAAMRHLEDTGDALQFPHPISIQAQFIAANQPGWLVHLSLETIKTGANLAYLQLTSRNSATNKIVWMVSYVFGSLERHRLPFEFEVAAPPPAPPLSECHEFKSPFKSKFGEFKVQMIPRGHNPMKSDKRVPAYMGFSDGRPLDLLSASLFADLFTDHRMFRFVHGRRDEVVRVGKDGKVPRGKVGIRTSGTVTMSVHFFNVPSPGTTHFLMDTVIGMSEGTGDYAIYMWDPTTKKVIGIARQVQQIWMIRNEEDVKAGIGPKL